MKASRLTELNHLFRAYDEGRDELFMEIRRIAEIFEMDMYRRIKSFSLSSDYIEFEATNVRFTRNEYDGIDVAWNIPFEYFMVSDEELIKIAKVKEEEKAKELEESARAMIKEDIQRTENKLKTLNEELERLNK
jgi:uncharacterized protein YlxW (UPF0749 family)